MKLSAFGPGIKAGGPNYCQQFTVITDKSNSKTDYRTSYPEAWKSEFSRPRDWNHLHGEQNVFRYLPLKGGMALRLFKPDTDEQALMVALAAQIIRTCSANIPVEMYRRAADTNKFIATDAPVKNGRIELIHYLKEQSIAFEYHRYGSGQDQEPNIDEEYK